MDRTRADLEPAVPTPVRIVDHRDIPAVDAPELLAAPGLLVIDGFPWSLPLDDLRRFQERQERVFDEPFSRQKRSAELTETLARFRLDIEGLLARLYGDRYPAHELRASFRPMISAQEPMHFDSGHAPGLVTITAYMNFSAKPREYGVSFTLPWLVSHCARRLTAALGKRPFTPDNSMVSLRAATVRGEGPLGPSAPRHLLHFAPGSLWVFDPKLVSHELRYGDGAVCCAWRAPALSPRQLPETYLQNL